MHSFRSSSILRPSRGAVLIVALLIMAMLALGIGSYLTLNLSTARLAKQSYRQGAAFHLAEAGMEEALWSLNRTANPEFNAWAGWTRQDQKAWRKFEGFDFGGGTRGTVKVYLNNTTPKGRDKPTAVAQAILTAQNTPPSTRMIEVTLSRRSYFAAGLVAKESLSFSGLNTSVDSWNSDPDGDPSTPPVPYSEAIRNDRGSIATVAVQNYAMQVNQASIWGYVATGGPAPEVGVNGSIRGRDTPADVKIDPARVTTDFSADLPLISAPVESTQLFTLGNTLGTAGLSTKWRYPSLTLTSNETLTILGDVTLILTQTVGSGISITGNASIILSAGSSLTVYVESDVRIAGNGLANQNIRPGTCRIFGTNPRPAGQSIQIAGNGALKCAVYAPHANVTLHGNGDIMGAVVGLYVTLTGNAQFHYDESLADEEAPTSFRVSRWRELSEPAEREKWQEAFANW